MASTQMRAVRTGAIGVGVGGVGGHPLAVALFQHTLERLLQVRALDYFWTVFVTFVYTPLYLYISI